MGGDAGPSADASRALEILAQSPSGSSLRLDANQAWSVDEALCFSEALVLATGRNESDARAGGMGVGVERTGFAGEEGVQVRQVCLNF